jgi:ATPase subunit of ABC transporter with duplicated ATPase domains
MAATDKPHISFERLGYSHPNGVELFTGLSGVWTQKRIGLIGENGVGKTTLVNILLGNRPGAEGRINIRGTIGYLPQQIKQHPGEALSGGELVRRALTELIAGKFDFLVLDEPTNNLDQEAREELYRFIETGRTGIIAISHDRGLLGRMDEIVEMFPDGLQVYGGNYDFYRGQKAIHARALDQRILTKSKELKTAERTAQATVERGARSARDGKRHGIKANLPAIVMGTMKNQAENTSGRKRLVAGRIRESLTRELEELEEQRHKDNVIKLELPKTSVPAGKVIFSLQHLAFSYKLGGKLISDLNYTLVGPKRIAIRGRNGSGKSTLAKLLMGSLQPTSGEAVIHVNSVGYLDQFTSTLKGGSSILDTVREVNPEMPESEVRIFLARLKFRRDEVFKTCDVLSGGERIRVAIARELLKVEPPQLLILDEPTNNLDLKSIERLESALNCYEGALLVISHDEHFMGNIGVKSGISLDPGVI